MSNNKVIGTGLTFMQILFLIFLVLKLLEISIVATWSWWWITAPLWGGIALFFVFWVIIMIFMFFVGFINGIINFRR